MNVTRFLLTCNGRRYSSDLSTKEFCLNKGEIAEDALHRTLAAFQTKECLHTADYAGGRKYYTYEMDYPDPCFDCPTELVAVSLNRNDGFVLKSWTGNCAYFDAAGNYLGMLPATLPEDPDDWITDDTIYVKCLKAQPTQMASAMTDMAVLAGAIAEGAVWSDGNYNFEFFEPINGCLIANLMRGAMSVTGAQFDGSVLGDGAWDDKWYDQHSDIAALTRIGYAVIKVPGDGSKFKDEDILMHLRKKGAEYIKVFTYFGHARGEPPIRLQLYSSLTDPDEKFLDAAEVQDAIGEREFVKLVFLSGCYTIDPIEQKPSIWKEAFNAETVIGWDGYVTPKDAAKFEGLFWDNAKNCLTIQGAFGEAKKYYEQTYTPHHQTTGTPQIRGSGNYRLNPAGRDPR